MDEVFPVLSGIVLGLVIHAIGPAWLKVASIGICGIALGTLASWISGELAVSWVYLLVDAGQVIAAAIMTGVLARIWLRRRVRDLAR
jgi:hypothetical protein